MRDGDPTRAEQDSWVGREVGAKYRILRLVGRGGMGAVYEAENLRLGKRVALKFIDIESARNPEGVQRFIREARAASAIESGHVVQVFDVAELDDGRPYMVMELLRGENLGALLGRRRQLTARETVHIAIQILRGLQRAHDNGIVHRDLKPENVFLVDTEDDSLFVKVVDFGISKITRHGPRSPALDPSTITREGVVLGTPFYMAPEQAQALSDLDHRADLWSLGAIMFECLAGRRPYLGDTYEQVIIAICTAETPSLRSLAPEVPTALTDVVMRALSRDREARYASALELARALRDAAPELAASIPPSLDPTTDRRDRAEPQSQDQPDRAPPTDVSWSSADRAATSPARRRRRVLLGVVGATTALIAVAAVAGLARQFREDTNAAPVVQSHAVSPPDSAATIEAATRTPASADAAHTDGSAETDSPDAAPAPKASLGSSPKTSRIPTPPSESSSLTGGLELKTDVTP